MGGGKNFLNFVLLPLFTLPPQFEVALYVSPSVTVTDPLSLSSIDAAVLLCQESLSKAPGCAV